MRKLFLTLYTDKELIALLESINKELKKRKLLKSLEEVEIIKIKGEIENEAKTQK